jgi:hypothetical protein
MPRRRNLWVIETSDGDRASLPVRAAGQIAQSGVFRPSGRSNAKSSILGERR